MLEHGRHKLRGSDFSVSGGGFPSLRLVICVLKCSRGFRSYREEDLLVATLWFRAGSHKLKSLGVVYGMTLSDDSCSFAGCRVWMCPFPGVWRYSWRR